MSIATQASGRDTAPAGTVEQLTRAGPVARGEGCQCFAAPHPPRRQSRPATRKTVVYVIVLYGLTRLPFDRRFQREVITLAIGLAAAKSIMQEGVLRSFKGLSAFTERNYLREKRQQLHATQ